MKNQAVGKDDLVKEIDKLGHIFATKLVDSIGVRFAPYMGYYHAMELIDPTAPANIPDGTWERVEDICNRYNLSYVNVRSEIRRMRDDAVDLSLHELTMCKANLLKFYRDKYLSSSAEKRYIHLDSYARVVFQLPFETVLIESLFSIMNYNKENCDPCARHLGPLRKVLDPMRGRVAHMYVSGCFLIQLLLPPPLLQRRK